MMQERYKKNLDCIFTEELQNILLTKTVSIIGCGAQGEYIANFIARLGVKKIQLWDGDIFEESNLNRQLYCLENNIGKQKAIVVSQNIAAINSEIEIETFSWYFGDYENDDIKNIWDSDFIFLSFDDSQNVFKTRELIKKVIINNQIPALDCPNNLLGGFIFINTYKDLDHYDLFTKILTEQKKHKKEYGFSTGYKCALIAAEAVNCMVQYFAGERFTPINSELSIDIYHHQYIQSDKYSKF